jgi:chorismate mutase
MFVSTCDLFRYLESLQSWRLPMTVRGVRGATTLCEKEAAERSADAVLTATRELMLAILEANPTLRPDDIASILFTVTDELRSVYPARAVREMGEGWEEVPLMCAQEIPVTGSLSRCVRVLIHWNTELPQKAVHHVYLRDAVVLRPDLVLRSLPDHSS